MKALCELVTVITSVAVVLRDQSHWGYPGKADSHAMMYEPGDLPVIRNGKRFRTTSNWSYVANSHHLRVMAYLWCNETHPDLLGWVFYIFI